jgi:hypothetical protein
LVDTIDTENPIKFSLSIMNIKAIAFLSLLTLSILSAPAFSQTAEIDISKVPTIRIRDWRNPSGYTPPWSTPVLVNDDFDGTYLAVFDHNFQADGAGLFGLGATGEHGFQSNWSAKVIRAYYYTKTSGGDTIREVSTLSIKVGGKVYKLTGAKGNFEVTPELAYALKTAPLEVAMIRAEFTDSGTPYSSDIGTGTVTAWRTVYQQAQAPGQVSSNPAKVNQSVESAGNSAKVNESIAVSSSPATAKAKQKLIKH